MAKCIYCGNDLKDGANFCPNCGAPVDHQTGNQPPEEPRNDVQQDLETFTVQKEERGKSPSFLKSPIAAKLMKWLPIPLLILVVIDFTSDPPAWTILLSIAIIAGGVFCLKNKCKFRILTILTLLIAVFCLYCGISQGKRMGFFVTPTLEDYFEAAVEDVIKENTTAANETKKPETTKAETTKAAETEKETTTEAETSAEVKKQETEADKKKKDGVDPDLKAFLDSYEECIDEYVEFMKKYEANPENALTMLAEYVDMMAKYEEFAEKADQYNSEDMSTEDLKYYLEVMNRCNEKMLDAY